jgi:type IV secretion system protein TrbL
LRGHDADVEGERRRGNPDWRRSGYRRRDILRDEDDCHGELFISDPDATNSSRQSRHPTRETASVGPREKMVNSRTLLLSGTVAALVLVVALPAHAQSAGTLDQIVGQFQSRAAAWESTLQALALRTFGILALIELAWAAFRLALRGSDMSEWLAEIVNQIFFLGFFLALLENSATWGQAIVDSFRQAGQAAGGVGVAPSDVFASGVDLAQKVMAQMSIWAPAASVGLMVAGIVIEICFALMAALMVVTLVQSYIVIAAGVINMAFGGTRWTKDIAVATVKYTVSVGAKLMVIQLLVSLGNSLVTSWAASFHDITAASLCALIGCSVVMLAVVKIIPDEFQRVVGGASISNGSVLVGAAATVAGAAGTLGAGAVGAGMMTSNAYRLASAQLDQKADQGAAPQSRVGRAAAMTGYSAKNVADASLMDLGRRLSGNPGARHGIATWRMSTDLANRRRLIRDDLDKPKPPSGGGGNSIG